MIALKIMASGSLYFAVSSRIGQSYMSTEFPFQSGGRLVFNGSGSQARASGGVEAASVGALPPPPHPVASSRPAPSTAASSEDRTMALHYRPGRGTAMGGAAL